MDSPTRLKKKESITARSVLKDKSEFQLDMPYAEKKKVVR